MTDWQITTLGEIINTGNGLIQTGPFGSQLHASDYVSLGVPVIMPINLVDNRISLDDVAYITDDDANRLAKHILKAGDIVYSRRGDVTRKALITEKEEGVFCGTGCLLIRPGYKVESKFLAYFLSTPSSKEWIIRHAVGATMPNLNTSILSKVPLLLPDFSMQKRIAKILGDLDDKITLNRQINQTLEAMAQALFKSWFVDFEPVKAKLSALAAGGSADDANLAAMSAISGKTTEQLLTLKTTHPDQFQQLYTTADLFPSEMVDSELGEIPKGWEVKTFGEFIERMPVGKKFDQKTASVKGSIPILDQGKSGVIGFHNEAPGVRASLENPVVVFANHTCYMRLVTFDFSAIQNVLPFVGKDDLDTIWVYYATKDTVKFSEYKGHWPDFVLSKAVVPPSNLTSHFRKLLQPFISQTRNLELESEKLNEIKSSLLPKLLSGELLVDGVSE
jgi:type I restriction enzyme S subunit